MTTVWTICGLIVPWAAGAGLVQLLRDRDTSRLTVIGAGWLLGQAMMMALLYGVLVGLGHGYARALLAILAVTAVIPWVFGRAKGLAKKTGARPLTARRAVKGKQDSRTSGGSGGSRPSTSGDSRPGGGERWWKVLRQAGLAIVAVSLLAKFYLLAEAHADIPVRNDDAISIWLFKAKVVAGLDELPLDPKQDYYQAGSNPRYPIFVALAAAWIPLLTGQWHEEVVTLPWLFYYVNLVLLAAGGLRRWLSAGESWLAAYLTASLPLLVVHVYRPGYADLLEASFLAGALLHLLLWRSTGLLRHLATALPLLLAAACLKRESPAIAAISVLAVLASSWRIIRVWTPRIRLAVGGALAVTVLIVLLVVDFSEQAEAGAMLAYHPDIWGRLGQHLFEWSSFHLLFWFVTAASVAAVFVRGSGHVLPALILTLGLCGFCAAVFVFTPQARFAVNDQTPSRLFLQLAPSLIIAWAPVLGAVLHRENEAAGREAVVEEAAGGNL